MEKPKLNVAFRGLAMGMAEVVPGVSGGTIARPTGSTPSFTRQGEGGRGSKAPQRKRSARPANGRPPESGKESCEAEEEKKKTPQFCFVGFIDI